MANRRQEEVREVKRLAGILIPAIREIARRKGYAIGVHGSLAYDIDLIAAPWSDVAVSAEELCDAVLKCCEGITGFAFINPEVAEKKPHGRLAWSVHVHGPYIDLSVMPRIESSPGKQGDAS